VKKEINPIEAKIKNGIIIYPKFYEKNRTILEYKNGTGYTRKYCNLNSLDDEMKEAIIISIYNSMAFYIDN